MVRRAWPQRTCVGCRRRAPAAELLRIVAVGDGGASSREVSHSLQPDPARRLPGRGAHLHPDPACFELAQRRRAFGRALRIAGVLDTSKLAEYLNASTATSGHGPGEGPQASR